MPRGAGSEARRQARRAGGTITSGHTSFSPTARAEIEHALSMRPDRRLALGSPHQMTRKAHQLCSGGCGCVRDLEDPKGGDRHADHAHGCGSSSPAKCGGRRWANRYALSTVAKNDHTFRIAMGIKRAQRIKERGW